MQSERWLFVSDVDDTLLGDDSGLLKLANALQSTSTQLIIVYNSSRPCDSLRKSLASTHLPTPDYLIGALGTEIQEGISGVWLPDYTQKLKEGWSREQIRSLVDPMGFIPHPDEFQTPLKVSYAVSGESDYQAVLHCLEAAGVKATVIFSGEYNLDIIPASAGKGNVIKFLSDYLNIDLEHVVVAGDSGNDVAMFIPSFKGIIVGNADSSLKQLQGDHLFHAQAEYASGVLEGLFFWRVLP